MKTFLEPRGVAQQQTDSLECRGPMSEPSTGRRGEGGKKTNTPPWFCTWPRAHSPRITNSLNTSKGQSPPVQKLTTFIKYRNGNSTEQWVQQTTVKAGNTQAASRITAGGYMPDHQAHPPLQQAR